MKPCFLSLRGVRNNLAALLLGPGLVMAAPKTVEPFDAAQWQALQSGLHRPAVVVFTTTDCAHCPAVIEKLARDRRLRSVRGSLLTVVMDVAPGEADAALLRSSHYRPATRLLAFAGQPDALRHAVNPAWRGVTPYLALLRPGEPPQWVNRRHLITAALFAWVAAAATAQDVKVGKLTVHRPHARATLPGQSVGAGYVTLVNDGAPDRLLGARSDVCARVELHTMRMQGDVMRMREVDAIELPRGRAVELKPGSDHLMLVGLKAPLKIGDVFALTLRFAKVGEVTVQVKVQAVGAEPMPSMAH